MKRLIGPGKVYNFFFWDGTCTLVPRQKNIYQKFTIQASMGVTVGIAYNID